MALSLIRRSYTTVDDVGIHVTEMGRGKPLVLLHGLADSHRTWLRVAPMLARTRHVIMPDLAGHGFSERPDASYTLEWHAEIIGKLLSRLKLSDIDLVGHSYGGGVALTMLTRTRPIIRRLGLVAAGGLGREVGIALRFASLPHMVERFGQPFMGIGTRLALNAAGGAYVGGEVTHLMAMNSIPGTARAFARSVRDVISWRGQMRHLFDRVHEVRQSPSLALFWGDDDDIIPFSHAMKCIEILEGLTLSRFPGCGHFPHRQHPRTFAQSLAEFLRGPANRGVRIAGGASVEEAVRSAMLEPRSSVLTAALLG